MTLKKIDHEFTYEELSYDTKPNYQRTRTTASFWRYC